MELELELNPKLEDEELLDVLELELEENTKLELELESKELLELEEFSAIIHLLIV